MDEDTAMIEMVKKQERIIQQLIRENELLEENIRILKRENTEQAKEYKLLYQIHTLTQEKEELTEVLTLCKAEKDQLVSDNCEKEEMILQLKIKLEAQETKHLETLTQETQTDRNDLDIHDVVPYTASAGSSSVDYLQHITNCWHTIFIERPSGAVPPGYSNTGNIYVYHMDMSCYWGGIIDSNHSRLLTRRFGEKIYYHGSNDHNVRSIIENGIDVTRSTRPIDFSCGGGFYVTKDFSKAVDWSRRVVGWKRGRQAVIAFKISQSLRKEEPHLALKVDTTTNRKWWECVVSHFRHGGVSPDVKNTLKDVKFIKGRVANTKWLGDEETPRPYGFTQLCIRNQDYAQRFGSLANVAFVLFHVQQ
ncbi:hypothetical protein BsWGS_17155 [Bradybaena similaris]